ncbi:MAG TPA: alpha/beta fold hydrolase, partial [Candidatus Dormibacteraeota bacterium]|nr:alpha/beta fold hydrolase [Candidatus Dormibacteraeota bacterium]
MSEVDHDRRRFLRNGAMGAMAMAAAGLSSGFLTIAPVDARTGIGNHIPITHEQPQVVNTFGPVKQIQAGDLNIGYVEAGPAAGSPVILLHGWPYDIHSYVDVTPLLAAAGYRVIVPYMRGFGTTTFLS